MSAEQNDLQANYQERCRERGDRFDNPSAGCKTKYEERISG